MSATLEKASDATNSEAVASHRQEPTPVIVPASPPPSVEQNTVSSTITKSSQIPLKPASSPFHSQATYHHQQSYSTGGQYSTAQYSTGGHYTGGQYGTAASGQFSTAGGQFGTAGGQFSTAGGQFSAGQFSTGGGRQYSSGNYSAQYYGSPHTTTTTRVDHSQQRIIAERVIEHEVKVPKKVVREDVVEKVIVIPEKIVHEEVIEDVQKIREKIIEVAMPVIQERVVEVPEIEYVEKIVEVPEVIVQEKIREVPRVEIQERIVEVPRIVMQEKIVEVPEIEYRDVPVEKIVEVPEIREQIVIKEVPVPQYVEKPVPEYVDVQHDQEIPRQVPIPVEAVTTCEFKLPRIRPRYTKVDVPLYVPRFVEVPIPMDALDSAAVAQAEAYAQQVTMLAAQSAVSMCEVENLAGTIKQANFDNLVGQTDPSQIVTQHWMSGRLQVDPMSMHYTTTTNVPHTLDFAPETHYQVSAGGQLISTTGGSHQIGISSNVHHQVTGMQHYTSQQVTTISQQQMNNVSSSQQQMNNMSSSQQQQMNISSVNSSEQQMTSSSPGQQVTSNVQPIMSQGQIPTTILRTSAPPSANLITRSSVQTNVTALSVSPLLPGGASDKEEEPAAGVEPTTSALIPTDTTEITVQ